MSAARQRAAAGRTREDRIRVVAGPDVPDDSTDDVTALGAEATPTDGATVPSPATGSGDSTGDRDAGVPTTGEDTTPDALASGDEPQAEEQEADEVIDPEELATSPSGSRWSSRDRDHERALLLRMSRMAPDDPERKAVRDSLVTMHLPLVEHLARRFRDRGEAHDDLVQVGTIGLIKAVDRFDVERGVEFSTYATPTIVGEIKRHFRDRGWAIRVPRRLQELRLLLSQATSELSQRTGRSPTVRELAEHLGLTHEEILEGLESAQAYSTLSLDATSSDDESDTPSLQDTLGMEDEALAGVEYRESLRPLLDALPPRERQIVILRFFHTMTQSQIAAEIGISQMHVSRLLARSLAQLREGLMGSE